jgi:4-hydroxy-3-methylbut-2-enyl diphosphate reductase IspH
MGHRVQQMRLAEANRRMGVERVEKRRDVDRVLFGDAACSRVSKLVRRADEKRREGQSTILARRACRRRVATTRSRAFDPVARERFAPLQPYGL